MTSSTSGRVMWTGTFGLRADLASRLAATAAIGYAAMSVSPIDIVADPASAVDAARAAGIDLRFVDPIFGWCGSLTPSGSELTQFSLDQVLDSAAAVGAKVVNAIALADKGPTHAELIDGFGRLCEQAGTRGLQVQLEFVPMSRVRTLGDATAIVRGVTAPNAGVCIDTWHFFRGRSQLADVVGLDVPVLSVQVSDAPASRGAPGWQETVDERLLPGEGQLPLTELLALLGDVGGLEWLGPEVLSRRLRRVAAVDAAHSSATATERVVAAATASRTSNKTLSTDMVFPRLAT